MKTYPGIIPTAASFPPPAAFSPANADHNSLVTRVPFEFTVGAATLPRDLYHVSRVEGHASMLFLRSARHGVFIFGQSVGSRDVEEKPRVVFHRYDNQYFLREIRFLGSLGLSLPETPDEREAKRRADRSDFCVDTVAIVAQLH